MTIKSFVILRSMCTVLNYGVSNQAQENLTLLEEVPTGWRLQNYVPGITSIYFAASPCASGALRLLPDDSNADKDRLWSLVLTAKAARKTVGVYFDAANGCRIRSFYMKEGD